MSEKDEGLEYLPRVPEDLRFVEVRLPSDFREIVADRHFDHCQIGRIVRCLLLKTDIYKKKDIEVEVDHYREIAEKRDAVLRRVRACRRKSKSCSSSSGNDDEKSRKNAPSQPQAGMSRGLAQSSDTLSLRKTPSNLKEEIPPLYIAPPLTKKKCPSSLEIMQMSAKKIKQKPKKDRGSNIGIQGELFGRSLAESTEMVPEGTSDRVQHLERQNVHQDVARDSRPVPEAIDARPDEAWIPGRFAQFWAQYPKKVAKKDAYKAFVKIIKCQKNVENFINTTLASLEWWKKSKTWMDSSGRYIPYPASWLNGGHWEDIKDNPESPEAKYLTPVESDEELLKRMLGET